MAMQKRKRFVNIPMYLAGVLFCLTLISIHLMSGLYAKYTTRAEGSDSARVISFHDVSVTETGDFYEPNKLMIIPGVDLTKDVTITFGDGETAGSESAAYIFAEIILSGGWVTTDNNSFAIQSNGTTQMQWSIEPGWTYLENDGNGSYIYYQELAPNTIFSEDIIAENGKIIVSEEITKSEISHLTDISMKIRATAVQSIGFEGPTAAWASIAAK